MKIMKKVFMIPVVAIVAVLTLISCMKDDTPQCTNNSLAQDRHVIDSFLDASASADFYTYNSTYAVYLGTENPGSGSKPASDSQFVFKSELRLLNGTLIDSGTVYTNRNGFPLKLSDYATESLDYHIFSQMMEGGVMKLIVPSSQFYGCQRFTGRYGNAPANSQVINTITLVDVKRNQ